MSLNKIELSPDLISRLYPKSLVIEEIEKKDPNTIKPIINEQNNAAEWRVLGANAKNILIVVHFPDHVHLPDDQLGFLTQLLTACKLTLNDVAIINRNNYSGIAYDEIITHFKSKVILLFDCTTATFGFPFEIPEYQVQRYAGQTIMHAPALQDLQQDRAAKTLLWGSLKKVFDL